jgi:hypothetical protein
MYATPCTFRESASGGYSLLVSTTVVYRYIPVDYLYKFESTVFDSNQTACCSLEKCISVREDLSS